MGSIYILLFSFFLTGCATASRGGDKDLRGDEIPSFLRKYLGSEYVKPEFFEKFKPGQHFYEVKYLEQSREISVSYDLTGQQIEREEDIHMSMLSTAVSTRIKNYLIQNYPGHLILELEKRVDAKMHNFIDVEIRHSSSPSGYWEISFTPEGEFVGRELENYDTIETLN